jgi:hypothetical protein
MCHNGTEEFGVLLRRGYWVKGGVSGMSVDITVGILKGGFGLLRCRSQ